MKYKHGELVLDLVNQDVTVGSAPDLSTQNMTMYEATPVNAEAESVVLEFSAPAIHAETLTLGVDTYEILADDAQELSDPSYLPVDVTSYADKSQGTLTIGAQPTATDGMVIGAKTYTFVANDATPADGDILIGGDVTPLLDAHANIVAAIAGSASEFVK